MLRIPPEVRREVDDRDRGYCRRCGQFLGDRRIHHHIHYGGDFRGMGGRRLHEVDNLVTLCNECHRAVHDRKHEWLPLLEEVIRRPGVTALQLRRWKLRRRRMDAR